MNIRGWILFRISLNNLLCFDNIQLSLLFLLLLLLCSQLLHVLLIPLLKWSLNSVRLRNESILILFFRKQTGPVLVMDVFHVIVFRGVETRLRTVHIRVISGGHSSLVVEAQRGFSSLEHHQLGVSSYRGSWLHSVKMTLLIVIMLAIDFCCPVLSS